MPRPPRLLLSKSYYHVMTRGNNRHKVFESDEDYLYYLKLIEKYKQDHPFDLYHYCLMPNHVHLLIQTNSALDFAKFMKKLNLAYFHHYRQSYGWVGHFWQDRYKSQAVGKDAYFIQCGKYIELNPVRAMIVNDPADWKWSSYRHYTIGAVMSILTTDFIYDELGANEEAKRSAYADMVLDDMVVESYKKQSWGSSDQRYNENKKRKNHFV